VNGIIAIFDETMVEIFSQKTIPKNLTQTHLSKLELMKRKISQMLKHLVSLNMRGTNLNKRSESFVKFVTASSSKIEGRKGNLRSYSLNTDLVVESSLELKLES
jgi:hypothetical protein